MKDREIDLGSHLDIPAVEIAAVRTLAGYAGSHLPVSSGGNGADEWSQVPGHLPEVTLELIEHGLTIGEGTAGSRDMLHDMAVCEPSSGQSVAGPQTPPALLPQHVKPHSPTAICSTFTTSTSPRLTPSTKTGPPTGFSS